MTADLPLALPYGIRDCKLTPYVDAFGTVLGTVSYDMPNMQTFSFAEKEEFTDLRGDDTLIATHGKGAQCDWSIEAGGVSLQIWAILSGGSIIETGTTPNRQILVRKRGTTIRPYFRAEGQSISDSGGDIHAIVYRCKCNDEIKGEFKDGEFFITNVSGLGLPLQDRANDLLYDFVQNETTTEIPGTPVPNPLPTPQNLQTGAITSTTVVLTWDVVADATGYVVEQAASPYSSFTDVTSDNGGVITDGATTTATVTALTASTAYKFRVRATFASGPDSDPSLDTGIVTTTA